MLIQGMVFGKFSGVIFSQNIIHDQPQQVMIEAVSGTGEGVVGGTQLAEQVLVDRRTLNIDQHVFDRTPLINQQSAKALAEFAISIENQFKCPIDIEFVYNDEQITLLQARPITTLANIEIRDKDEFAPPTGDDVIWTCHNVQEAFPKTMTPFTMSIWQDYLNPALNRHQYNLGIKPKKEVSWLFGYFYNKVHVNVSAARKLSDRILGQNPDVIMKSYLGKSLPYPDRETALTRWFFRIKSIPFVNYQLIMLPRLITRLNKKIEQQYEWLQGESLDKYSDKKLLELHDSLLTKYIGDSVGYHITTFTLPTLAINLLRGLLESVYTDKTDQTINILISGLENVESAQISKGIWALSRIAKEHKLNLTEDFNPYSMELPQQWLQTFSQFISANGHRGLHELAFEAPVWRDEPSSLIKLIYQQITLPDDKSPLLLNRLATQHRLQITKESREKLNVFKRTIFNLILQKAQQWTALREFSKSVEAKGLRLLDPIHNEFINRITEKNNIINKDDFWFLTINEINALLSQDKLLEVNNIIVGRRKAWSSNQFINLPEYFYGYPDPIKPKTINMANKVLEGVSVNTGFVTAKARVITDFSQASSMQPGEILVTHISDAAWTPLFTLAAGIVVDIGSMLSHSSIVAREFGIPAVINVKIGTQLIQTGDLVTVDGDKGEVIVEKRH